MQLYVLFVYILVVAASAAGIIHPPCSYIYNYSQPPVNQRTSLSTDNFSKNNFKPADYNINTLTCNCAGTEQQPQPKLSTTISSTGTQMTNTNFQGSNSSVPSQNSPSPVANGALEPRPAFQYNVALYPPPVNVPPATNNTTSAGAAIPQQAPPSY